ncbi:MAG: hypothetical protein ACYDBB_22815 [Armatimonadota bacterium]
MRLRSLLRRKWLLIGLLLAVLAAVGWWWWHRPVAMRLVATVPGTVVDACAGGCLVMRYNNHNYVFYDWTGVKRWKVVTPYAVFNYSHMELPSQSCALSPDGMNFAILHEVEGGWELRCWRKGKQTSVLHISYPKLEGNFPSPGSICYLDTTRLLVSLPQHHGLALRAIEDNRVVASGYLPFPPLPFPLTCAWAAGGRYLTLECQQSAEDKTPHDKSFDVAIIGQQITCTERAQSFTFEEGVYMAGRYYRLGLSSRLEAFQRDDWRTGFCEQPPPEGLSLWTSVTVPTTPYGRRWTVRSDGTQDPAGLTPDGRYLLMLSYPVSSYRLPGPLQHLERTYPGVQKALLDRFPSRIRAQLYERSGRVCAEYNGNPFPTERHNRLVPGIALVLPDGHTMAVTVDTNYSSLNRETTTIFLRW